MKGDSTGSQTAHDVFAGVVRGSYLSMLCHDDAFEYGTILMDDCTRIQKASSFSFSPFSSPSRSPSKLATGQSTDRGNRESSLERKAQADRKANIHAGRMDSVKMV